MEFCLVGWEIERKLVKKAPAEGTLALPSTVISTNSPENYPTCMSVVSVRPAVAFLVLLAGAARAGIIASHSCMDENIDVGTAEPFVFHQCL